MDEWKSILALFGSLALMVVAMAGCEAVRHYCNSKTVKASYGKEDISHWYEGELIKDKPILQEVK